MDVRAQDFISTSVRFSITSSLGKEIAWAYLCYSPERLNGTYIGLYSGPCISNEHKGQQLEEALLAAVLKAARRYGCRGVLVTSSYTDDEAHELYRKNDFDQVGDVFHLDLDTRSLNKKKG